MSIQLGLGVRLRDISRFASFFSGRNQVAIEALRAVRTGEPPTCVFLQGGPRAGKSHLLQALCAEGHGESAAYLPLRELLSMGPETLAGCGELDRVCVDDVELIAHRRDWELALFALHQQLDERQRHLIVASSLVPAATGIELADLRSRFGGGLVLSLQPLDEEERVAALQLRSQIRGFELPVETALFLLRRLPRDMATLCDFLDRLDEASIAAQRQRISVPFVSKLLDQE
ncbi:MAG: DnaA regulatory inactivator Hda [Povalibacter sp.]